MYTVGQLIVDTLVLNDIDRVFCVPGESYLGLLDALYGRDDIDTVVCRHESGAGFMALADARLTRRPGVALVSRGPGACNASIAVHTAQQDEVPFILIVGQIELLELFRPHGGFLGKAWMALLFEPAIFNLGLRRLLGAGKPGVRSPREIAPIVRPFRRPNLRWI